MFVVLVAALTLMNNPPISASGADDATCFRIPDMLSTAPLLLGMSSLPAKKKWPPTLLRDLVSDRYDALECTARTMLLAWYVRIISFSVAILTRKSLHFHIVSSVGFTCSDASALSAVSSLPFISRAKKRKKNVTSWMNLGLALLSFWGFLCTCFLLCLGAVDDLDVWVWLMLWFGWVDMVESCQGLLYCVWHCEVQSSNLAVVVSLKSYSAVLFGFPFDCALVVFLDCVN